MIIKTPKTVPDRTDPAEPAIGSNGHWWAYDDKTGKFADTGVKAKGDTGAPGKDGKDGHTLYVTAKLTGSYRNYKTTGIKLSVSVYYDGAEINIANTTAKYRLRGGVDIYKEWTAWGAYSPWMDSNNRNGAPLENEVKVTYKGLTATAYARLEHVIDGINGKDGKDGAPGKDGTSQYTKTSVDARALDPDTYYPVTFDIGYDKAVCDFICRHGLGDKKTADWMTHTAGFSIDYAWEDSRAGWQGGSMRKIHRVKYGFASVIPAGDIWQNGEYSKAYIYVRGGGKYYFTTGYRDGKPGPVAVLHTEDYTFGNEPYVRSLPLKTSVTLPETEEKRLERLQNEKAEELRTALDNTNSLIEGLSTIRDEIRAGTLEPRKFADIQYLLDALQKDGSFKTGILLSSVIALSGKDGNISSYLSGARGDGIAMLRAGVEHFAGADGKPETAQTTIWSDGSVDIGDMHFVNEKDPKADHIDFTDKTADHTYLQIGGAPKTEAEMLSQGSTTVERELEPVYQRTGGTHLIANVTSLEGNRTVTLAGTITAFARAVAKRIDLPPNTTGTGEGTQYLGSRASVSAHIEVKVYSGSTLKNTYTSQTLTAQAEVERFTLEPRDPIDPGKMRNEVSKELPVTLAVPIAASSESMVVSLVVTSTGNDAYSTAFAGVKKGIKVSSLSSNRKSLVSIMRDKVAFFFSRQKYLLFNYLSDYLVKIVGNVLVQGTLKADHINTDSINGGIAYTVLAHGWFDKYGQNLKFKSISTSNIRVTRLGQGYYKLSYPSAWGTSLFFVGSNVSDHGISGSNTAEIYGNKKVAFSMPRSGYVYVFTSDDASRDDADVYFQIVKY